MEIEQPYSKLNEFRKGMRKRIFGTILAKRNVSSLYFVFLVMVCVVSVTSGQTRQATTIDGTIDELLTLLENKEDKRLIRNYVVKSTERFSSREVDEVLKSFRSPTGDLGRCDGISKAEQLEKALLAADHLSARILTKGELEKFNFGIPEQKLTWALIQFETPPCEKGHLVMYFVKLGPYWYLKN